MSSDFIFSNTSRVAVVVGNTKARQTVVKSLTAFRFEEILQFSSPEELIASHRFAELDWIVTEIFAWCDFNAVKMLEDIRTGKVNGKIKVSFLIKKPEDNEYLSRAFELGLLSNHLAKYAYNELTGEFSELYRLVSRYKGVLPLVAAHYARAYLDETGKSGTRLQLERALSRLAPFHPDILFRLSEVEFVHGHYLDAVLHLRQAALLAPEHAEMAEAMQAKFLDVDQIQSLNESLRHEDLLGFRSALIIDRDAAAAQTIVQALSHVGVGQVMHVETGDEAIEFLKKNGDVELLITEWKLRGQFSGSALIQRVRQMRSIKTRIIVVSSLLKKSDEYLLDEIGVETVLPKPLNKIQFLETLVEMRLSGSGMTSARTLMRRINGLLSSGHAEAAEPLIQDLLGMKDVAEEQKLEVKAHWALIKRHYKKALTLISESLVLGNSSAGALTTMGRILLKLRDFRNASLFLERAQLVSPDGVQRLLDLSEAKLGQNDLEGAKSEIAKAAQIDPGNEWVLMADCQVEIERGETKAARNLLNSLQSGNEITAQMNNRAIALAQVGEVNDSISLYLKTLEALPPSWKSQIAKVTYNLGMAYARNGNYAQAEQMLRTVSGANDSLVSRAGALAEKIKNALENNLKLNFQPNDLEISSQDSDDSTVELDVGEISARASFRPGELCLWGLFSDDQEESSESDRDEEE